MTTLYDSYPSHTICISTIIRYQITSVTAASCAHLVDGPALFRSRIRHFWAV
jgi:hypothetical protein